MQLLGGKQQRDAAQSASLAEQQGGRDAINAGLAVYNQNRQDNYNNMVVGNSALSQLAQLYGLNYYDGQPSYGGITVTGGETTEKKKKRSLFDKFTDPLNIADQFGGTSYDPAGLFSSGVNTSTSPMQFGAGGGGAGFGGGSAPGNIVQGGGMPDYSAFYMSPDFLVRQREGIQGLDRGAAARGRLYSGGADADRMRLSADIGAQGFGDYRNSLLNLAGYGQQATSQVGQQGSQLGALAGNAAQNAGNARASGYINQSNSWQNTLNGLSDTFGNWYGNRYGN
jgi:hypothetical protein